MGAGHEVWAIEISGLSGPQSVVVDPVSGSYFIANQSVHPQTKADQGFVSKVSKDGLVIVLQFIQSRDGETLHGIRDMVILGRHLYITDTHTIHVYDVDTGLFVADLDLSHLKPELITGLTSNGESILFALDQRANAIYEIDIHHPESAKIIFQSDDLYEPTAICYSAATRSLLVATGDPADILEVKLNGTQKVLKNNMGFVRGMSLDSRGDLFIASSKDMAIYRVNQQGAGAIQTFRKEVPSASDLYFNPAQQELVTCFPELNKVITYSLENASRGNFIFFNAGLGE